MATHARKPRRWAGLAIGGFAALALGAADPAPPAPASLAGQEPAVLAHLNEVLGWYRQVQLCSQWIEQPSDAFFWSTERGLIRQTVQDAFASAQIEAGLIARDEGPAPAKAPAANPASQRLSTLTAANLQRMAALRLQLAELDAEIARAGGNGNPDLAAHRSALQAELDLDAALDQSLGAASAAFADGSGTGDAAGLASQIAALQRLVPDVFAADKGNAAKAEAPLFASGGSSGGLLTRSAQLFSLIRREWEMDKLIDSTGQLKASSDRLAAPLLANLRQTLQAGQAAGSAASGGGWSAAQADIETATARFKSVSAALAPLREESMALGQSRENLGEWRGSFAEQNDTALWALLLRAVSVLAALGILAGISEAWRRAAFKYIHEARRRHQFLVIRRFCTGVLVVAIVVTSFVSDFSSLATAAGFITAGIAVALQTVILSVAAYFFLIGRYGIKIGDRVTVSGVTGNVINVGLARMYLMELTGSGADLHPTGRIAIVSNSALFSNTPMYKQLPGTHYAWREAHAPLAPEADTARLQEVWLAAVGKIYEGYRSALLDQHGAAERLIDLKLDAPAPSCRLRFADQGVEIAVRYPVEISRIAEIDAAVAQGLKEAVRDDPALKSALTAEPRVRPAGTV